MPGSNVRWPVPLQRLNPWYPGQFGVPGAWTNTGERLHCTGKILYVDPNFPGTSDSRDGTDPTSPLTTIQAAVDMTTDYAGDVIVVMQNADWQYAGGTVYTTGIAEDVTLDRAGVRLVGLSPGGFGVPWQPATDAGWCLTVSAIDCIVEGFVFQQGVRTGANGIYCEWDGVTLFGENLVVQNCTFVDDIDIAVQLEFSWYCTIRKNFFQECDTYGVYVDTAGSGIAYCTIEDNHFMDCAIAVSLLGGCDNNAVLRNFFYNASAQNGAAATDEGLDTTGGDNNMVCDNYFSCLLPVPANGDIDDLCTGSATDAWVGNHCSNGLLVTTPT